MSIEHPLIAEQVRLYLTVQALLAEADSAQWQRSRIIAPDEDEPTIRGQGEHSDPTFDAVSDPSRLALRVAVLQAEDVVTREHAALVEAITGLQKALDRWNGGL